MQNFISVVIVSMLSLLGLVSTEPLTWRLIKVWFPVNVIFVGMLITSMFRYAIFNFIAIIMLSFLSLSLEYIDHLPKGIMVECFIFICFLHHGSTLSPFCFLILALDILTE